MSLMFAVIREIGGVAEKDQILRHDSNRDSVFSFEGDILVDDYSNSNPSRLLLQARKGGRVGELFELYRSYLKVLARMHVGQQLQGKVDASDVVQETFMRANRGFPQFHGVTEQELLSWLRKILVRVLVDFTRQYLGPQRDVRLEQEMDARLDSSSQALDLVIADAGSTPSQQVVRKERAVLLANAIEELPEDYRQVLILHHLEQLSFLDVSRHMSRSVDSVKHLWARALVRLKQSLAGVQ